MSNLNDTMLGKIGICPYCNNKLKEIPSRKKKCEFCGEFIYVRTRPQDRKKVLVTKTEADEIENQWQQQYQENEDQKLLQNSEYSDTKKKLSKAFGKDALMNDVKWAVYEKRKQDYLLKNQWGLYRNNKLDQANLLISESRYKQALPLLFEVCYLDINGASNCCCELGDSKAKKFNLSDGCYIKGVINILEDLLVKLKYNSIIDTKSIFIGAIENLQNLNQKIPIDGETAWLKLILFVDKKNQLESIDPKDTKTIIAEINERIVRRSFSEASELIYKLSRNNCDSKIIDKSNFNLIKVNLENWLYSENFNIARASQYLFWSLLKKDYANIRELTHEYICYILQNPTDQFNWTTVSQFYKIDRHFLISLIPKLIEILKNYPEMNVRRICVNNIKQIGENEFDLIKDAIPLIIDYLKNPKRINKSTRIDFNLPNSNQKISISLDKIMSQPDEKVWLCDAYLECLIGLAEKNKQKLEQYKPIFQNLAKNDKSEYIRKKAQKLLNLLN